MVAILDAFLIVQHLPIKSEVLQLQVWSVWSAYTRHPSGPTSAVCLALLKSQAVSMEVPFWRVQRLSQGDELDGPSKDTARTLRNLLVSFESRCQASRLKCALTAAEADETGNGLLVNAAVSPSQRRSPPMPGP